MFGEVSSVSIFDETSMVTGDIKGVSSITGLVGYFDFAYTVMAEGNSKTGLALENSLKMAVKIFLAILEVIRDFNNALVGHFIVSKGQVSSLR